MVGRLHYKCIKVTSFSSLAKKIYTYFFGTIDLHTHIRYRESSKYFKPLDDTIDIGCGEGIMPFEYFMSTQRSILGVCYTKNELDYANSLLNLSGFKGISFKQADANTLVNIPKHKYNQCFLIDVLEHIQNDRKVLSNINSILVRDGYLVLSTPTPDFPIKVSSNYANDVGHVRDGYTIENISKLLKDCGFKIISWHYYTGVITSFLCSIYYGGIIEHDKKTIGSDLFKNVLQKPIDNNSRKVMRVIKMVCMPIFYYLTLLDNVIPQRYGSSIALLAQKVRD